MTRRAFSEEELRYAVRLSKSLSHTCKLLGLGGYNTEGGGGGSNGLRSLQREIRKLSLDTSHFYNPLDLVELQAPVGRMPKTGPRELKHQFLRDHILLPNTERNLRPYRPLLVEMGVLEDKCDGCDRKTHTCYGEEKSIRLEIDHIDGNHHNNSPENLRQLCPCCHALQPTDSGHHRNKARQNRPESPIALRIRLEREHEENEHLQMLMRWMDDGGRDERTTSDERASGCLQESS